MTALAAQQNPMAILAHAPVNATEPALSSTGAKGAAAHELMRRFFAQNKTAYTAAIRRDMAICAEGKFDPDDSRCTSARAHFGNEVPVGNARTLAFLGFGVSMAWDALATEEPVPGCDLSPLVGAGPVAFDIEVSGGAMLYTISFAE